MDDSYDFDKDNQMPTVLSLSTLEPIKLPETCRYGACRSVPTETQANYGTTLSFLYYQVT